LIRNKPLTGHGTGNFLSAWNKQSADFYLRHPDASLPKFLLHPHNEIFFWMIELGLPALIGILVLIAAIGRALYYCGFQRGGAYAAMLLPISLHTQVEHPFYISSIHWFLWLFLLFVLFRHQTKLYAVNLSNSALHLIQITAFTIAIGGIWFLVNTAQAQIELKNFMSSKASEYSPLQIASNNLYFSSIAEQAAMRKLLFLSIKAQDREQVKAYEDWGLSEIKQHPVINIYSELFYASKFLRPEEKGCDILKLAIEMYPQQKPFQVANKGCGENLNTDQ